ncbi:hypothetical protein [Evansella tamaricis]|uniref:Uncharacterized protein n=1 Tax=Evansella tamaricis TaxID=2069301 RepID=A0ABS6JAF5_9BACI|nr:hypothetical protein [Evansella tamaricis]MBU9710661.1 hypothetical protein [Evansella tamaricis]
MVTTTYYYKSTLFFKGKAELKNGNEEQIGILDFRDEQSLGVDVLDLDGNLLLKADFLAYKTHDWVVRDGSGNWIGTLKLEPTWFAEKYIYDAGNMGSFPITPKKSRHFKMRTSDGMEIAEFYDKRRLFRAIPVYEIKLGPAYDNISKWEAIVVMIGVFYIKFRIKS